MKLIERCLRAATAPGDLVLDPFTGVASTGVPAQNLGRKFIGIEVEKEFVDIGKRRLKNLPPIGDENRHVETSTSASMLLDEDEG